MLLNKIFIKKKNQTKNDVNINIIYDLLKKIAVCPKNHKLLVTMILEEQERYKNKNVNIEDVLDTFQFKLKLNNIPIKIPLRLFYEKGQVLELLLNNSSFEDIEKINFIKKLKETTFYDSIFKEICDVKTITFNNPNNKDFGTDDIAAHKISMYTKNNLKNYLLYLENKIKFGFKIEKKEEKIVLDQIKNMVVFIEKATDIDVEMFCDMLLKSFESPWFQKTRDNFKSKILIELLPMFPSVNKVNLTFKKIFFDAIFKHMKILDDKKIESKSMEDFLVKYLDIKKTSSTVSILSSVNMLNENIAIKIFDQFGESCLVSRDDSFKFFAMELNTKNVDNYKYIKFILTALNNNMMSCGYNITDGIKDEEFFQNRPKELDFIYLKENIDVDFIEEQFDKKNKDKYDFLFYIKYSFENIHLMEQLYIKKPHLYDFITKSYCNLKHEDNLGEAQLNFYTDDFLKMDQNFKEDFLKKIAIVVNRGGFKSVYDNFQLFEISIKDAKILEKSFFPNLKKETQLTNTLSAYNNIIELIEPIIENIMIKREETFLDINI